VQSVQNKILEYLSDKKVLIQPDAMQLLLTKTQPVEILKNIHPMPYIITKEHLGVIAEKPELKDKIKFIDYCDICEPTSEGFKKYFLSRYYLLEKLISKKFDIINRSNINNLEVSNEKVTLIGMCREIKTTKNNNTKFILEDAYGSVICIVKKNDANVIDDEVVGVYGKWIGEYFLVENVIRPDIPVIQEYKPIEDDCKIAFIGDIHFGSKTFVTELFEEIIHWLNGEDKIKYVVICGDIVDGVGIYPHQEDDLEVLDVIQQYQIIANKLKKLRKSIKLVIIPGNHDFIRFAEPQPKLGKEIMHMFDDNCIFLSNPSYIQLYDIPILVYHGRSSDDFILNIPNLSYAKPLDIMKEMLMRRHLAPIYGGKTPIAPIPIDRLVITTVPKIFVMGHTHNCDVGSYKSTILISTGAWQEQTKYQKMHGIFPDIGKVITINLKNFKIKIHEFT